MSAFLEPADIEYLTGYKQPKKQKDWLRSNGIHFLENGASRPVVPADLVRTRENAALKWSPKPEKLRAVK